MMTHTTTVRPLIGTRVTLSNGKHGTVTAYPLKPKHATKVAVHKDGETGCNSVILIECRNLAELHEVPPSEIIRRPLILRWPYKAIRLSQEEQVHAH